MSLSFLSLISCIQGLVRGETYLEGHQQHSSGYLLNGFQCIDSVGAANDAAFKALRAAILLSMACSWMTWR